MAVVTLSAGNRIVIPLDARKALRARDGGRPRPCISCRHLMPGGPGSHKTNTREIEKRVCLAGRMLELQGRLRKERRAA